MSRRRMWRALLPAAALLAGLGGAKAASVGTTEYTQFLLVWLATEEPDGLLGTPALLNLPPGWLTGDAIAVLAPGGAWPEGQRDRLVSALLDAGAAVLELDPPRGGATQAALRAEMAEALRTSEVVLGAGLVVAIGRGEGGEAALELAAGGETVEGRQYAAAVHFGPGAPAFLARPVPEAQGWPLRAPLLCDVLASVVLPGDGADFLPRCQAALALQQ